MMKAPRQKLILEIIGTQGLGMVSELADRFEVSEMTIRRDLDELASREDVKRIHGGAMAVDDHRTSLESPIVDRMGENREEKQLIAVAAARNIDRGMKVFIGSGTTIYWVAKNIKDRQDLTVYTNSLMIVNQLISSSVDLVVVGGYLRKRELSFIGFLSEEMVKDLYFDQVIMGVYGINVGKGLVSDHLVEMNTDQEILKMGVEVVVVADHTKYGSVTGRLLAPLASVDKLFTSEAAPASDVRAIRDQGVQVIEVGF